MSLLSVKEVKDDEPEYFTLLLSVIGEKGDGDASSWWWHCGPFSVAREFGFKAVHLEHTVRTAQIAWVRWSCTMLPLVNTKLSSCLFLWLWSHAVTGAGL